MSIESDIRKEQKAKLRLMSPKEKCSYIWAYYKFHILISLFILLFLFTTIRDIHRNSRPHFIDVLLVNASPGFQPEDDMEGDYAAWAGVDTDAFQISIDASIQFDRDGDGINPLTLGAAQKFLAVYAAGDVDAMLAPEAVIENYLKAGIFTDPTTVLTEAQINDLTEKGCELYIRKQSELINEEEEEMPAEDREVCIGIKINSSSYLSENGVFPSSGDILEPPVIFTFSPGSDSFDNAVSFLEMIIS
ncbi:MAG: hypothetical protein K6G83_00115 [Lachnospiraceae bacterium]|nr:hypothetical protein [Lachnospiraceae bacterium]